MTQQPHEKLIQENRVFLVTKLDIINTSVLDQLRQDDVLTQKQLESLKERCPTNIQLSGAVLGHLCRRSGTEWEKFLRCLTQCGQGHILEHLQGHRGYFGPSLVQLQQKIAAITMQLCDMIPLWTLYSDFLTIPMDELYVDMAFVKDKHRAFGSEEHLQSYKDIFEKSTSRSTIYLSGEPGVGKSTFTQHVCFEWAKIHDKGTKIQKEVDAPFGNYQFVLTLLLRDVKKGQSLCAAIAEEYQLGQTEARELYHHINNPEESILIIADGLDEYSEGTSEEITKLLHREILPHITLFITSRFSIESFYAKDKPRLYTEITLRGFSDAGVQEYLDKFFSGDAQKRDSLLQEFKKTEELEHYSHIPAILLMMATLWEENQQLPSTIAGFYEEFVAYVFARIEKKQGKIKDRAKSTKEILKRYNAQIMALGCLATGNMETHKLELKFKREDIVKHIGSDDLKFGFLIEKRTFSREVFYIFIHKTVQEYFIAYHLVYSDKSTKKVLLLRFFNSRTAVMGSAMICRFVAGLGGQEIHEQLESLIKGKEWEMAVMHTDLQLEYLAEHQNTALTLPRGVKLDINNRYPGIHYVRYLSQDGGQIRKMWIWSNDARHWRLLQHLRAPQLTCLELNGWSRSKCSVDNKYISQTLEKTLTKFPLKSLTTRALHADHEASAVVRAVVRIPTLLDVTFWQTPLTGERIRALTEWLPSSQLTSLTMPDCRLTSQEIIAALSVLPPSLQTLDVRGNDLTELIHRRQLSGLTRSHLWSLDMYGCHLTPCGVLAVIDAAPETLKDLNLRGNCRGRGDDLFRVTERTIQLAKLKVLNLQYNNISCDVVVTIKQKLKENCPQLQLRIDDKAY